MNNRENILLHIDFRFSFRRPCLGVMSSSSLLPSLFAMAARSRQPGAIQDSSHCVARIRRAEGKV